MKIKTVTSTRRAGGWLPREQASSSSNSTWISSNCSFDIKETIEKRSYCTGAQAIQLLYDIKENFCDPDAGLIVRDFPSTLSIQDRELRNDKSTFTTKESDYLCSAVTVRSISPQLPSSPWVIYRGSAARSLSP